MGWGAELLARLGEAAWYLLITGAQRRGSPGTPARGGGTRSAGYSRLPEEGGRSATWATALLTQASASWL